MRTADYHNKPTAFIVGLYRDYEYFIRSRKSLNATEPYKYVHISNTRNLRGQSRDNCIIFCIGDWTRLGMRDLHEIFHWARFGPVRIEERDVFLVNHYYFRYQEASLAKNALATMLTKIFLSDGVLHQFICNEMDYDKKTKTLTYNCKMREQYAIINAYGHSAYDLWNMICYESKKKNGIDALHTVIQQDKMATTYINNGKSLPHLSREITELPMEDIQKRIHEQAAHNIRMRALINCPNTHASPFHKLPLF